MKNLTVLSAGLALILAAPGSAQVVYDNGAPNNASGNDATLWIQAENFTLGAPTQLTGAGVYLGIAPEFGGAWDGNLAYYLYGDTGGMPGSLLQSGSVSPTVTNVGSFFDGTTYLYEFSFSPFWAAAFTNYWFGIHAAADFDSRDDVYWVTTNPTVGNGVESLGGTQNNWTGNYQEHAFYLTSTEPNGGVPEPGTWAMMLIGFGATGVAMRRRRNRIGLPKAA